MAIIELDGKKYYLPDKLVREEGLDKKFKVIFDDEDEVEK